MAARHRVTAMRCPNVRHRHSRVTGHGTYVRDERRFQRYRCVPLDGVGHTFTIPTDDGVSPYAPAPACAQHSISKVIRDGTYGVGERRRQRYRCQPVNERSHAFTPPLPRAHVHPKDGPCPICDERKSVHRGDPSVARRHRWSASIAARALAQLADGDSYGKVGKAILRSAKLSQASRRRRRGPTEPVPDPDDPRRRSRAALESRRAWRLAANMVEAFAPIIWEPIEARLRAAALAERARLDQLIAEGEPLDRPQVWLLDDAPVWGRAKDPRVKRRDGGFFLLVIGEITWEEPGPDDPQRPIPRLHLRLVRAMAKSNAAAWRLAFAELGYEPDFVVADAGTGIQSAVDLHFDPERTKFIPSIWHVRHSIIRALGLGAVDSYRESIFRHLDELGRSGSAMTSQAAWVAWWDEFLVRVRAEGLSMDKALGQRRNYEEAMWNAIPDLVRNPGVPVSTGGLETLIREHIDRVYVRRTQFANIERTNLLFDLVIAGVHHAFDDLGAVARALRTDAERFDGWTIALRPYDDPRPEDGAGAYSSLRDPVLLNTLAAAAGL